MGRWCWSGHENIRGQELEEGRPRQRRMGQSFLRRPGPTKGCRANDDDDDDDDDVSRNTEPVLNSVCCIDNWLCNICRQHIYE
jgi:hypothetical protein